MDTSGASSMVSAGGRMIFWRTCSAWRASDSRDLSRAARHSARFFASASRASAGDSVDSGSLPVRLRFSAFFVRTTAGPSDPPDARRTFFAAIATGKRRG